MIHTKNKGKTTVRGTTGILLAVVVMMGTARSQTFVVPKGASVYSTVESASERASIILSKDPVVLAEDERYLMKEKKAKKDMKIKKRKKKSSRCVPLNFVGDDVGHDGTRLRRRRLLNIGFDEMEENHMDRQEQEMNVVESNERTLQKRKSTRQKKYRKSRIKRMEPKKNSMPVRQIELD